MEIRGSGIDARLASVDVQSYVAGRGEGKGKGSGLGHGRHKNPEGNDGLIMKRRICRPEDHFARNCPQGTGQ
eukprot:9880808-Alexandrium_andersonii.AAC.1